MEYLSYPPEILHKIIDGDFETWKSLIRVNKYFYKLMLNVFWAKDPLQNKFGRWYFLAYLKSTRMIFNNNKETIFNEIINSIPKDFDLDIILELFRLILEDKYKDIFYYIELKINSKLLDQKLITIILTEALRVKNKDYALFKLLAEDKKESLKLELFKAVLYTTEDPILRRLAFTRLENNGFKADAKVTLMFLRNPGLNLFVHYASSLFRDRGVLLLEAFKYLIKNDKTYNNLAKNIISKMDLKDVVLSFYQCQFDNIKSDDLSYDLLQKFLDYSIYSSEFTTLVKKMIEKELNFNLKKCIKIIKNRKRKISFILDVLEKTTTESRYKIKEKLLASFKNLSENRQKKMKE